MRKALCFALAAVLLIPLSGCSSKADSMLAGYLSDLNTLADAIEAGDQQLEKETRKRIRKAEHELPRLQVTKSEGERLKKKYEEPLEEARERVRAAMQKKGSHGEMPGLPVF
jgi:hypothetical protein